MAEAQAAPLGPDEMPLPMGVQAESGDVPARAHAATISSTSTKIRTPCRRAARATTPTSWRWRMSIRTSSKRRGGASSSRRNVDRGRPGGAGTADRAPAQAGGRPAAVQDLRGPVGLSAEGHGGAWLNRFNVGLAVVDPLLGVPLYLLIVGSPEEIPFEFQYLLDAYWSVGRLHFDTPAEYRAYAEGVIAYETARTVPHRKHVAVFSVRTPATARPPCCIDQVAMPLVQGTSTMKPLGERQGSRCRRFSAKQRRRKTCRLLRGQAPGGAAGAAVHRLARRGLCRRRSTAARQARRHPLPGLAGRPGQAGALLRRCRICRSDAQVNGMIHFFFACYGGGCPKFDTYSRLPDGTPKQITAEPMVARLPAEDAG